MERITQISVAALVIAVCALCFAGMMSVEQATAQNVQAVYLSLHQGGQ